MKCFFTRSEEPQIMTIKSLPARISNLVKKMKPVLDLTRNKQRTNAVTPSTCNYDVETVLESRDRFLDVHFKFVDEEAENEANERLESLENEKNEELEIRLKEARGELLPALQSIRYPTSVNEENCAGGAWAPSADADIRNRGGRSLTGCQRARVQTRAVPAF